MYIGTTVYMHNSIHKLNDLEIKWHIILYIAERSTSKGKIILAICIFFRVFLFILPCTKSTMTYILFRLIIATLLKRPPSNIIKKIVKVIVPKLFLYNLMLVKKCNITLDSSYSKGPTNRQITTTLTHIGILVSFSSNSAPIIDN